MSTAEIAVAATPGRPCSAPPGPSPQPPRARRARCGRPPHRPAPRPRRSRRRRPCIAPADALLPARPGGDQHHRGLVPGKRPVRLGRVGRDDIDPGRDLPHDRPVIVHGWAPFALTLLGFWLAATCARVSQTARPEFAYGHVCAPPPRTVAARTRLAGAAQHEQTATGGCREPDRIGAADRAARGLGRGHRVRPARRRHQRDHGGPAPARATGCGSSWCTTRRPRRSWRPRTPRPPAGSACAWPPRGRARSTC